MAGSWNGRMLGSPQHSDHDDQSRAAVERFEADIANLLRQVPSAPLVALNRVREVLPYLDLGYHRLLHQWLKIPFAVASEARNNPDLIANLHAMMPKRVKRYDPKDILRHTLQIAGNAFDIRTTPYSLACERERALRPYFDQGVDPRDLPRLIEEAGGIGILDDDQREQAKAAEAGELPSKDEGACGEVGDSRDGDGPGTSTMAKRGPAGERVTKLPDDREPDSSEGDPSPSRRGEKPKGAGRRDFNRSTDLAVTTAEETLHKVLSLPPGTPFTIHGVVEEPVGAWKKFRAKRVDVGRHAPSSPTDDLVDEPRPSRLH